MKLTRRLAAPTASIALAAAAVTGTATAAHADSAWCDTIQFNWAYGIQFTGVCSSEWDQGDTLNAHVDHLNSFGPGATTDVRMWISFQDSSGHEWNVNSVHVWPGHSYDGQLASLGFVWPQYSNVYRVHIWETESGQKVWEYFGAEYPVYYT